MVISYLDSKRAIERAAEIHVVGARRDDCRVVSDKSIYTLTVYIPIEALKLTRAEKCSRKQCTFIDTARKGEGESGDCCYALVGLESRRRWSMKSFQSVPDC